MVRIACLYVPDFPLAAWLRVDPELRGSPVAITDGVGPRARIVALSPEAARQGVSAGLNAAQGRAICSRLVLRAVCAEAERGAQVALCDVAESCSPRLEEARSGTVYLDASGLCGLYQSEAELARALVARAVLLGIDVSVGIASSRIAAQLAARDGGGVAVLAREEEWQFLAVLPIGSLEPSEDLRRTFARWGIARLGDLAALPAGAVATRLGPEAALLARRARGEDERPLVPRSAPLRFEEAAELDYGVDSIEPLLFVARATLDRLLARLALRGLVCGDLRLSMRLANRARDDRVVPVAVPSNDTKSLLALLRLQLESRPPCAPIEAIRLAADPQRLRAAQLDLFRPRGPAPEQLAVTLARLDALCGAGRVGTPMVVDSYRGEVFAVGGFCPRPGEGPSPPAVADIRVALRAIRPPLALDVFCNRDSLDFVRPAAAGSSAARPRHPCTGRVVTTSGPWRVQGEWWQDGGICRDYYDVQLSDGVVYRLFYEARAQRWFVDGVYD